MAALQRLLSRPATHAARGVVEPGRAPGNKRIVVSIEANLFDRVALLASASGVSFAEAVRQLIERGFEQSVASERARRAIDRLASGRAEPVAED